MKTASRSFIGDVMVVRATRDMQAGEEVTFWYERPDGVRPIQEKLKNWGFECSCAICVDARSTPDTAMKEHKHGLKRLKDMMEGSRPDTLAMQKVERILAATEKTYRRSAIEVPRLALWGFYLALANGWKARAMGRVLEVLGFEVRGFDEVGDGGLFVVGWGLVIDHVVVAFLVAKEALVGLRRLEDAKRAEGYARTAFEVVVGESSEFKRLYEQLGLLG